MKELIETGKDLLRPGVRWLRQQIPGTSPRAWRPSWLAKNIDLRIETDVHPHTEEENADLFISYDKGTTEMEILNWLHATALMCKPKTILETGAHQGFGTVALASACRDNGFGVVHSVELDEHSCEIARERLKRHGLLEYCEIHCASSLDFLEETTVQFEFLFFDSMCEIRAKEAEICFSRGLVRGPAVFHDTSLHRTKTLKGWPSEEEHIQFREDLFSLAQREDVCGFYEMKLSRGIFALFPES